jgi:DinB superfamily
MPGILSKEEIISQLKKASGEFSSFCSAISHELFFRQPTEKWSVAQNVTHLITSANMTKLAYRLPKFIVRIYGGKPNRASRRYDELVAKYKMKLAQGGRASGAFIAKPADPKRGRENILHAFTASMDSLIHTIQNKWNENQLDKYISPHPLLGKITLRELGYFTIYHTEHHLSIIKERLSEKI